MLRLLVLLMMAVAVGCRKSQDTEEPTGTPSGRQERTTADVIVGGLTGRDAVRAGEEAKRQLRQVSQQEREALEEVLSR